MRVGLFGGSFNPPHLGHLIVAETARAQEKLDGVLWMPAAIPPHKQDHTLADPAHRLKMVLEATDNHPNFEVSDLELKRSGPSYTVDTLAELHEEYPEINWVLILGGDSLRYFHTWYRPDEILNYAELLVYARPGTVLTDVAAHIMARTTLLNVPAHIPISSTDIRRRVSDGASIRYLVPEAVRVFIQQHRLYREQ